MILLEGCSARLASPYAVLAIYTRREELITIEYLPRNAATLKPIHAFAREVCRQLDAYFRDPDFRFDLPCAHYGTAYQHRVWEAVRAIPRGSTRSYAQLARDIGSAPRPVGTACGANRLPLLVPCHRVLGSNGLGGFMHVRKGEPLDIKRWLLKHEHALH
jgi:methylated-DNA-[protein]-cysteine S-methyltransferase